MRLLLICILLFAVRATYADVTVHHSSSGYYYCNVTPLKCSVSAADTATRLSFTVSADNGIDNAEIYWALRDSNGYILCDGNLYMDSTTYSSYRDICITSDTTARAQYIYGVIHDNIPTIVPIN